MEFEALDDEIKTLVVKLQSVQRNLDKTHEEYISKGGDIVAQRQN